MNEIIDSHVHLEDFRDLHGVLRRAKEEGVIAIVTAGVNQESNKKILEICKACRGSKDYPVIFPSLGIHPGDVIGLEFDSAYKLIEDNVRDIVAISEIGLDYWYKEARRDESVRKLQENVFERLLALAKKWDRPVVIHSRGAHKECFERASEAGIRKAVFHWYSGPDDILDSILKAGYLVSAAPSLEYSAQHQRAIRKAPLQQILLETDSPVFFKPQSGKYRSEPKDLSRSLKETARIKGLSEDEVARNTTYNALTFFNLSV